MSEPDSDDVGPDDSKILSADPAPNEVCIISSDPLQAFVAALNPALRDREEFTIIVDRRRADSVNAAAQPAIERRRHPSVDARVKTDGFAIVPLATPDAPPRMDRVVDNQSEDDDAEADDRELRRIVEFKRRRKARVGPLMRISVTVGAFSVVLVLFHLTPVGKSLVNRARPVALATSAQTLEPPIEPQAVSVAEAPVPLRPSRPPAERISRPREVAQTPTEVLRQPPRPQSSEALHPQRRQASAEAAAATASNFPPPVQPGSLSASPLDPPLASEGFPRRTHAAATSDERPAHLSSGPRQPSARGLGTGIEALKSIVTSDVNTAGAEAQRQLDELKSKTMTSLAEMQRIWNNATPVSRHHPFNPNALAKEK
jgi:hypothetical protein